MRSREKPGGKVPSTDVPSSPPIRKSLSKRKNGARCRQESMAGHTEGPQKKASPILAPNNTPCSGLTPVASGAPSVSGISAIMDPLRRELSRPAPESSRPRKGQLTKAKMNKSPYHSSPSLLLKRAMTLRSPKKMLGTAEKTPQSAVGKAIQTRAKMGGTVPSTNTPSSPPIRKSPAEKKSSPQSRQVKPAGHTKGLHPRALPGWAPNKTTCPSLAPTTSEAPSVSPIPAITCPFRRELSRPAPDSITARKQQLARSKMNKAPTHSIPSPVSRRHITLRLPKKKAGTEEKTLQAAAGPAMRTRAKTRGKVLSTDTPRSPSIQKSPSKDYNGPQSWQEKLEGYTEGPHIRTSSASPLPGQEMQEKLEGYTKGPHIRTSSTSGQEGEENLEGYTKGPHIRTSSATAHPGQEGEEKLEGYTKGPHIRTSSASAHPGQQGPEEARQDAQSMQLPNNNQEEQKDNVWNDQNLEPDPHLPPGWRTIRDTSGTYYWHVPSGTTQWQHPVCDSSEESAPMLQEVILQDTVWTPRATAAYSFLTFSKGLQYRTAYQLPTERPYPRPVQALNRSTSLSWPDEDLFQDPNEPGSTCFAVRSLGWVEIPEEDLACGKSGITVNNCIQQITNSHHAGQEGQNMVMILKKDTMSLVDPLDHSLIHSQPILNIRVWGVGCNNGRDFAFVANDKDTCMLKCHVFRCDVPAKAIASALHTMCSQMISEKATSSNSMTRSVTMETISPEDFPLQVDILDAVRQSIQRYDTLYVGRRPVSKPMGIEVLNEMIEKLTTTTDRERWKQGVMEVSDTVVAVHPPEGDDDDDLIWDCQVRYVTFIGVGKDPRTFAMIVDVGNQQFQCTVFWCEPDAGHISEAVQAACMVQYQKCLVASSSRAKASSSARSFLKMKRTASVDSPISPFTSAGHPLQKGLGSSRKRGMKAIFEAFKQKHSMMHTP